MDHHKKSFLVYSKKVEDIRALNKNLRKIFTGVFVLGTTYSKDIKKFLLKEDFDIDCVLATDDLFDFLFFPKKDFTEELSSTQFIFYSSNRGEYERITGLINRGPSQNIILLESKISIGELLPLKNALEKLKVFTSKLPPQSIP